MLSVTPVSSKKYNPLPEMGEGFVLKEVSDFSLTSFFILFGQFYDIAFSIFLGIYGREK